jgi:hypothetical protein
MLSWRATSASRHLLPEWMADLCATVPEAIGIGILYFLGSAKRYMSVDFAALCNLA